MTANTAPGLPAMPELLPCPFCGTAPRERRCWDESLYSHATVEYLTIVCDGCSAESASSESHEEVRAAWNRRTPVEAAGEPVPEHRGYVLFGAGAYLLSICEGDERGPELAIHLATEEEKIGRTVGDLGNVVKGKEIPLERVAVRLQFASERGLFALEQQLQMLREEYFPAAAPQPSGSVGDAADAARYRFMRGMVAAHREDELIEALNEAEAEPDTAEKFDAAIDAAMATLSTPKEQP